MGAASGRGGAEVGHVLRRAVIVGELPRQVAADALADLAALPLRRAGHLGLLDRAWALRGNLTFYDALCVALAEPLAMELVTLDARWERAPGVQALVRVIA